MRGRLIGPEGAFNHDWRARVGRPGSQDIFVARGGTLPRPESRKKALKDIAGLYKGNIIWADELMTLDL